MSTDGPALVAALLLQCLSSNPDPVALGMAPTTAPPHLPADRRIAFVLSTASGTVYEFRGLPMAWPCGIAVYGSRDHRYLVEILKAMKKQPWNYAKQGFTERAGDGFTTIERFSVRDSSHLNQVIAMLVDEKARDKVDKRVSRPEYPDLLIWEKGE